MTEILTRPPHTAAFAWGYNSSGGLGLGHVARAYQPVPARLPEGTADVQGGGEFTVARTFSGELYAAGGNVYGQLGDGTRKTRLAWDRVPLPRGTVVTSVQAGADHVLALTERGEVYAWGRNHRGQSGTGSRQHQLVPGRVIDGEVTAIGAGNAVSAAINREGQLLSWGRNGVSQLGLGSTEDVTIPTQAQLPRGVRATGVDAGYHHMVVLAGSGDLFTFGADSKGKPLPGTVALEHGWGQVRMVRAGETFTLALTSRGLLLAWGSNSAGQLGTGDLEDREMPVVVEFPDRAGPVTDFWAGTYSAVALTSNHEIYTWGETRFGQGGNGRAARPQTRPSRITALDGAHLNRVHGGANHVIVTT